MAKINKDEIVEFANNHYKDNHVVVYKRTKDNPNLNTDKSRGLFRGVATLFRSFDADIRPIPSYTDGVDSLTFYSINN